MDITCAVVELGGGKGWERAGAKSVTYISHSQDLLHFKFTALGNKLSLCAIPSARYKCSYN